MEGLGEREIGRDLRHEAGDTRELYSGEFESEESWFGCLTVVPSICPEPTKVIWELLRRKRKGLMLQTS